MLNKVEK